MKARILSLTVLSGCDGVKVGNGRPGVGGTAAKDDDEGEYPG